MTDREKIIAIIHGMQDVQERMEQVLKALGVTYSSDFPRLAKEIELAQQLAEKMKHG